MGYNVIHQTERIDFILPNEDFVNNYLEMINNPELYIYITLHHTDYTLEDEINWVHNNQDGENFTLIDRETGNFIGNCGFVDINGDTWEIGIILVPEYHNNHYGREAINELVNIAFNTLNLNEVTLVAFDFNHRGIHCYEACGFETYNVVLLDEEYNGNQVNDVYMRVLR